MRQLIFFRRNSLIILIAVVCILGLTISAQSQFNVISIIPTNGATRIDTATTFQIRFSAPLDTSARFDYPHGFYLNLIVHPDSLIGNPDSVTLSADLKTVFVHNLHLWPDTKYLVLINKAVSLTKDSLSMPYLVTFTTGNSLPTASVAGAVIVPGGDAAGTAVTLMTGSLFSEEEIETESAIIVPTFSGNYTIQYVPAGTYWPVAVQDFKINSDGEFQPVENSMIGFYDPNQDGKPDSIVISAGQKVTGIDISMISLASVTARQNFSAIENTARSWAVDAALVAIAGPDVSPSGRALNWIYAFYSTSIQAYRTWLSFGTMVIPVEMSDLPGDTTVIPANWLDSDVVTDSAEFHGGSQFRMQFPDASIMAFLGNMEIGGRLSVKKSSKTLRIRFMGTANKNFKWQTMESNPAPTPSSLQKELIIQNSRAVWGFLYYAESSDQQMFLMFDAMTGKIIRPPEPSETTARFNLDVANQAAQAWAPDAKLVMAGVHQSELSPDGKAMMWYYIYHSINLDSVQVFILSNNSLLFQGQIWEPPTKTTLPANWIDSDVAMKAAEANGGSQYRASHADAQMSSSLSYGLLSSQPNRAVWVIVYTFGAANPLTIYIDAITGKFIPAINPNLTTARFNLDLAEPAAKKWASDAELVWVGTHQSNLSPEGKAEAWFYAYYSASTGSGQAFFFSNRTLLAQMGGEPPSKIALPPNWIDSDSAMNVAEAQGGAQYRAHNQNVWVSGGVSPGLKPDQPDRAVWKFDYTSSTAAPLTIFVIASTRPISITIAARFRLQEVNKEAQVWAVDAVLTLVGPIDPLPPDGLCRGWTYVYYSQSKGSHQVFYALAMGPISSESPTTRPPSPETLPANWIDSDLATAIAEANGGSAYRSNNPGAMMVGMISRNQLDYWGRPSKAVWKFMYDSDNDFIIIYIDAVTGAIIPNSDPILTTAQYNLEAADFLAQGMGTDARQVYVMNNVGNLSPAGVSEAWLFVYYSAAQDNFRSYQVMSGQWAFTWPSDGGLGSKDPLPPGWINSDQATSIADAHGGSNFRASFADAEVQALLTKNFPGEKYNVAPEIPVWFVQYNSISADSHFAVLIHALNGKFIPEGGTDLEFITPDIPSSFVLNQNFPNPFNPETVIEYQLPQASNVEISIFNLNGQIVTTLVKKYQSAGNYKIRWNGKDESGQAVTSGIYLYQLKAGNFVIVRKMLLIH